MKKMNKLTKLFKTDKEARLRAAFYAIRHDIKSLEYESKTMDAHQEALKASTNDWVIYLDQENQLLRDRVRALEMRLSSLELKKTRNTEDTLSVLELV